MQIIIAESEANTLLELEQTVSNLGHQVVGTVSTGDTIIKLTKQLNPDLVLVDLDLKGEMKGVDAGKTITEELNIPVIFITVFTKNCLTKSLQLPEDAVTVSKPVKHDHLNHAIQTFKVTKK